MPLITSGRPRPALFSGQAPARSGQPVLVSPEDLEEVYAERETERRTVIIAGGGYAGTTCAVALGRGLRPEDRIDVLLLALSPCQQALSELDLVAVGPPRPQFCELWHPTLFQRLPVTVCYTRLADVDSEDHLAVTGEGEKVAYWRLVLATGAVPFVPPVPGLAGHAITMWSVEDAQTLQQQIDSTFKEAAKLADREQRSRALSFTVVGGGATGVEIMGTLAQMLPGRLRDAGFSADDLRLRLIEGREEILPTLPAKQRAKALEHLTGLRVEVITGEMLNKVEGDVAFLASGRKVDARVLVWAGGARPDPHAVQWGLEAAPSGRLKVDEFLKAKGRDDIYVIGDVAEALKPGTAEALPMLAQVAIQEGPAVASNILREAHRLAPEPFKPHIRGEFVSVGRSWGVGWAYGIGLTGFAAILMKRITYIKYWFQVGGVRLALKRTRELLSMWG